MNTQSSQKKHVILIGMPACGKSTVGVLAAKNLGYRFIDSDLIIQETEGILKDGRMHIGDNDLLKVHLLNSAVKMSVERGRGKLVKLSPTDHIDGTAALLDAMTVRMAHFDELGQRLKNEGK